MYVSTSHAKMNVFVWRETNFLNCFIRHTLPDLKFEFNGRTFNVSAYDYTFVLDYGFARSAVKDGNDLNDICISRIMPSEAFVELGGGARSIIHGLPFLQRYYSVYNMTDSSVSLINLHRTWESFTMAAYLETYLEYRLFCSYWVPLREESHKVDQAMDVCVARMA